MTKWVSNCGKWKVYSRKFPTLNSNFSSAGGGSEYKPVLHPHTFKYAWLHLPRQSYKFLWTVRMRWYHAMHFTLYSLQRKRQKEKLSKWTTVADGKVHLNPKRKFTRISQKSVKVQSTFKLLEFMCSGCVHM